MAKRKKNDDGCLNGLIGCILFGLAVYALIFIAAKLQTTLAVSVILVIGGPFVVLFIWEQLVRPRMRSAVYPITYSALFLITLGAATIAAIADACGAVPLLTLFFGVASFVVLVMSWASIAQAVTDKTKFRFNGFDFVLFLVCSLIACFAAINTGITLLRTLAIIDIACPLPVVIIKTARSGHKPDSTPEQAAPVTPDPAPPVPPSPTAAAPIRTHEEYPTVTTPLPTSEALPAPAPITPPVQIKRRIPVPNVGTITIGINRPMSEQRGGMGRRLKEYVRDCVVLAITATGYGPQAGEMVELAAIKLRNLETVDTFCQLIKPRNKLTAEETANTGITNLMLSKAPGMDATLTAFAGFVGDDPIVGFDTQHNLFFIYDALIAHTDIVFSNDYLDLQRMAWKTLPDIEPDHLSDIYVRLGCPQVDSTRTMGRCETIMQCYKLMASMDAEARVEPLPEPEEAKATEETEDTEAPKSAEELHPAEDLPPDAETAPAEAPQPVEVKNLLVSVIDWVLTEKRPTVPAIQKEFGISRGKAKQIMTEMELLGVVGPAQSSKPREVLVESNPLGN